jgi:hypothetical protein
MQHYLQVRNKYFNSSRCPVLKHNSYFSFNVSDLAYEICNGFTYNIMTIRVQSVICSRMYRSEDRGILRSKLHNWRAKLSNKRAWSKHLSDITPKRWMTFNSILSQKMEIFISTDVRTSKLTQLNDFVPDNWHIRISCLCYFLHSLVLKSDRSHRQYFCVIKVISFRIDALIRNILCNNGTYHK